MPASPKPTPAPARAYGGVALEERVAARRARFIAAAIELFGTQGFRGATVRRICAAAGLTDRYFYESFESLEALLGEVFRTLTGQFAARLSEAAARFQFEHPGPVDSATIESQANVGYELWFDFVRDPRFARIVLVEVLGVSPAIDALYEELLRAMADLTIATLIAMQPTIRLPRARRELLGRALVGCGQQVAKMWMTGGYRLPRRDVVRTCVLVATGTLAALRAEADAAQA